MLAYDFPLLAMFWTLMISFLWIAWIVLLFRVIADIFRSRDLGGVAKALWALFVIVLPWIGVLAYLVVRGGSTSDRDFVQDQAMDAASKAYLQRAVQSGSAADELTKLANLQSQGLISEAEFAAQKSRLLS